MRALVRVTPGTVDRGRPTPTTTGTTDTSVLLRTLPLRTRLENGFVALRDGRMTELLSKKDLQNMNGDIGLNLDPVRINLTKAEQTKPAHEQARIIARRRQERLDALAKIRTAMLRATHLIAVAHGTYAIDDTAIWARRKADRRAPTKTDMPSRPLSDEDSRPQAPATLDAAEPARSECLDGRSRIDRAWGGKTGKDGETTLFFGYKAHVMVNTNDPKRKNARSILIQALELTPASQDIVDVSLRLIDEIRARGPLHASDRRSPLQLQEVRPLGARAVASPRALGARPACGQAGCGRSLGRTEHRRLAALPRGAPVVEGPDPA